MTRHLYSLDDFKPGESVWLSGISFYNSGRLRYMVKPCQTKIVVIDKSNSYLEIDKYIPGIGCRFYDGRIGNELNNLNLFLSKTREESIGKLNDRIEREIEDKYGLFRSFESRARQFKI